MLKRARELADYKRSVEATAERVIRQNEQLKQEMAKIRHNLPDATREIEKLQEKLEQAQDQNRILKDNVAKNDVYKTQQEEMTKKLVEMGAVASYDGVPQSDRGSASV